MDYIEIDSQLTQRTNPKFRNLRHSQCVQLIFLQRNGFIPTLYIFTCYIQQKLFPIVWVESCRQCHSLLKFLSCSFTIWYLCQGPFLNNTKTHLQRVLGDDNVLMVKFAEDKSDTHLPNHTGGSFYAYNKIARDGILLGLRRYRFFGKSFWCLLMNSFVVLVSTVTIKSKNAFQKTFFKLSLFVASCIAAFLHE